MSSYVPPHLRGSRQNSSQDLQQQASSSGRTPSYGDLGRADSSSRPPMSRNSSSQSLEASARRSGGGRGGGPPEAQFPEWHPSERVRALQADQIEEIMDRLNVTVEVEEGEPPAVPPIESFKDMTLHQHILDDIAAHKYETPTPIQSQGIPVALSGRDILGCAETGSGKTASFAIPMIQHCLNQPPIRAGDGPLALVLAPTRELAQQIDKEVGAFSHSARLRTSIVVGGVQMGEQRHALRQGVEVVVATPGRFIDHLQQGNTTLSRVSYLVLDEADRMLDMGFEPQIREVLQALPARHQTLLFSATMPKEIEGLAAQYLRKPVKVKIGKVSVPTANVAQSLERCGEGEKLPLLVALLQEETEAHLRGGPEMTLTIVFVERKTKCDEVASALAAEGVPAAPLHGGLSQWERESALSDFSAGKVKVLVATDVASRGLDVKGIGHVVNMDLPRAFEDYVHRIGRTGRAGTRGRATSFYTDRDAFLVSQIKTALQELERGNVTAFAMGKEARKAEKELAQQFRANMKLGVQGLLPNAGSAAVKVDDKYSYMATAASMQSTGTAGAADAAWDD